MAVNNSLQESNYQLLVRVSDNLLLFDEDVWLNLNMASSSSRVIVLSVIGQPKSKKTSLLNDIICSLEGDANISSNDRFPFRCDNDEIQSENEEGILVYKCETRSSIFLLLDIWSTHLMKETYNKLVDFCLVMSSIVIYSESWEEETSRIYWWPALSNVTHFERSLFQDSLELHFLIEADKYCRPNNIYLPGQPSEHRWDNNSVASIHATSFDAFWKKIASYVTTSYIPSALMPSSDNKSSLKSSALTQILLNCLDTPVRVNDAEQIAMWIAKCVKFVNGQPSTPVSDSIVSESSDIEMKCFSICTAQEDDASMMNKTSLSENYANVSMHIDEDHCEAVVPEIEPSRSEILQKCLDCVNFCISRNDFAKNILDEIIAQNFPDHSPLRSEVKNHAKQWLTVLQGYDDHLTKKLRKEIVVDDSEFEELHHQSVKNAKEAVGWSESKDVDEIIERLIQPRKTVFWNSNELNFEKEKQIADAAQQFAVARFRSLLKNSLSVTTFTESEFQAAYDNMVSSTSRFFLQALGPCTSYTKPWMDGYKQLEEKLSSMRTDYTQQNKNQLEKIYEIRDIAIETAARCYQAEMGKNLPGTALSKEKLDSISQTCGHAAKREFHQKIGKHISKDSAVTWEKELSHSIEVIKSVFVAKNEKLPAQPKPTIQLHTGPLFIAKNEELPASPQYIAQLPTGIGLYIDQKTVVVSIDQQSSSGVVSFEHHHNIAIFNRDILFGTEALRVQPCYQRVQPCYQFTVFQLLTDVQNWSQYDVNVAGIDVEMGAEAILSLYFHEIRMKIERRVRQRISSCFVTITGLLSSKVKQMLKTSLTIAGFERNTLIASTTALAILYARQLHGSTQRNLFIYISSDMIELATADVSNDRVNVLNICGNYKQGYFGMNHLNHLMNIVSDRQCTGILVWTAHDSTFPVIPELEIFFGNSFVDMNFATFDTSSVIKVAAMLDSKHNHSSALQIPQYNWVHPYRIHVSRRKKEKVKREGELAHNGSSMLVKSKTDDALVLDFIEQSSLRGSSPFTVEYHGLECGNGISFSLGQEGNLSSSQDREYENELRVRMKPIIDSRTEHFKRKYNALEQPLSVCIVERPSNGFVCKRPLNSVAIERPSFGVSYERPSIGFQHDRPPIHGKSEKSLNDLKESVTILIEKTKLELTNSQLTPAAHIENIESKIKKCEELMKSANIKVKQLEIQNRFLEQAAQFIK